jgi:hypothetical protein
MDKIYDEFFKKYPWNKEFEQKRNNKIFSDSDSLAEHVNKRGSKYSSAR